MIRSVAALAGLLLLPGVVAAQTLSPQDQAYELASVEAEHDVCGFVLTDEQQEVIAQRRDALATAGELGDGDIAALQAQLTTALKRQPQDALCRPDGPEAKLFKRRLTTLGIP